MQTKIKILITLTNKDLFLPGWIVRVFLFLEDKIVEKAFNDEERATLWIKNNYPGNNVFKDIVENKSLDLGLKVEYIPKPRDAVCAPRMQTTHAIDYNQDLIEYDAERTRY